MAEILWPRSLIDLMLELPDTECASILAKVQQLEAFPEMYPVRSSGPFRGHRWFLAGRWLIYYRVVEEKVFLRAIYPARLP
jgi:hypothetical protein